MNTEKEFDFFGKKEDEHVLADDLGTISKNYRNEHTYPAFHFILIPIATIIVLMVSLLSFFDASEMKSAKVKIENTNKYLTEQARREIINDLNKMNKSDFDRMRAQTNAQKAIDEMYDRAGMDTFPKELDVSKIKTQNFDKKDLKKMEEFRSKMMSNEMSDKEAQQAITTLMNMQAKSNVEKIPN